MKVYCKVHGFHDCPKSGCPDCKKQVLDDVVKKWGGGGCPECEGKDELLKEVVEALGVLVFECDGIFDTRKPSRETYNKAFYVLQKYRKQKV